MTVLFDITARTETHEITRRGVTYGETIGLLDAMHTVLDTNMWPVPRPAPRPVVPGSIEDIASTQVANAFVGTDVLTHNAIPDVSPLYAATVDGVQEIVPPWRRTPPAKAIYTNAQFDKVCGERNVEDGTRCASLKKHRGVHAWRMVSDGAQPQPANNLEASTG